MKRLAAWVSDRRGVLGLLIPARFSSVNTRPSGLPGTCQARPIHLYRHLVGALKTLPIWTALAYSDQVALTAGGNRRKAGLRARLPSVRERLWWGSPLRPAPHLSLSQTYRTRVSQA